MTNKFLFTVSLLSFLTENVIFPFFIFLIIQEVIVFLLNKYEKLSLLLYWLPNILSISDLDCNS